MDEAEPPAPICVQYCGVCTMPLEYCAYSPSPGKCRAWLQQQRPDLFEAYYPTAKSAGEEMAAVVEQVARVTIDGPEAPEARDGHKGDDEDTEEKKHQSRGGKSMPRDESRKIDKEEQKRKKAKVVIKMVERNRRKAVTHIRGMEAFGLDLKKVAKRLASKYACGCSVVKNPAGFDEVVVQGDFTDDLANFVPEEWPEVPAAQIEISEK